MKTVNQFGQELQVFRAVPRYSEGLGITGLQIAKAEQASLITYSELLNNTGNEGHL